MPHPELRKLPSVDRLLQQSAVAAARAQFSHDLAVAVARDLLDGTRAAIIDQGQPCPAPDELAQTLLARLHAAVQPTLQPVINASGVIIHTNLGRAPLSQEAQAAMLLAGEGYSNLEYDLAAGRRGSRYLHAVDLLRRLTGAEDALVVNNNAGAVLLCLMALAHGRQVVISRGQMVEIGGGFRIPDVLLASGALLVEVGATNRTHLADYQAAIGPQTAALLRVHSSNFRQIGFTAEVSLAELVALGRQHGLPVIDDLGSGALLDTARFGLAHEPHIQESVQAGAALVTFSGDKLLGGPQAGLIVGRAAEIARLRQHPLTRALRVDKTTLAALAATLGHYLAGQAEQQIPIWRMIAAREEALADRAAGWAARLTAAGLAARVQPAASTVGGGALPGETLPTCLLALPGLPADRMAARLRTGRPAVVARIVDDALCFDPRTVLPEQEDLLLAAILAAHRGLAEPGQ
ncbi:MAG TPA: L-seryl-tRNA(Sec) selenium transferase [Anaerolineae bacterium]|nr:L-seryl-tRNA(Sec) selenium transferase [Anaerolineae bacterium]HNU03911.1 L-seryl-tRNA(Sec) selenium transferase [Anaerolineae bacterium]